MELKTDGVSAHRMLGAIKNLQWLIKRTRGLLGYLPDDPGWSDYVGAVWAAVRRVYHRAIREAAARGEVSWQAMTVGTALVSVEEAVRRAAGMRCALVKQDVYQDLYCCPNCPDARTAVLSSLMRSGPVALLTKLGADFWTVKTEPQPECSIWKEKWFDCRHFPLSYYESLKTTVFMEGARGHTRPQGDFSVSVYDVNWGLYDVVIGIECPVPADLTRKYPNVVWCYYIGEPGMRSAVSSLSRPVTGYDLFLNQKFRCLERSLRPPMHVIEFPYFLQYVGCFRDLGCEEGPLRKGIVLEQETASKFSKRELMCLGSFGAVEIAQGSIEEILTALMRSKYYVRLGSRRHLGNAAIEAISAGCLAIGNPSEFAIKSLMLPETSVTSRAQLIERIRSFEEDPGRFDEVLAKQRQIVDFLCFSRPVSDLLEAVGRVRTRVHHL
ncbi:MAG TPA: hypothetical protein DDW41_00365 [Candidatus Andersenbacteria bacterium]|nr:hypothetical protein [Candidatus Andersenbacteria bacterium]